MSCVFVYCSPQVVIDKHPVRFFVHKRPHVDFFLEVVSLSHIFPISSLQATALCYIT